MKVIEIKDYMYDLKYEALRSFNVEYKCSKCDMCITESVSYEYEEYESFCLNGKNIEDEYCFIPLFISKIKARFLKEKILKQRQKVIAESYEDMAEWHKELDKRIKSEK